MIQLNQTKIMINQNHLAKKIGAILT